MAKRLPVHRVTGVLRTLSSLSVPHVKPKGGHEFDHGKATGLFESFSASLYSSSPYAHEVTVRRLARSLRFADIESLLEAGKANPRIKEERFLCTFIRSYGLVGMFNHALRTYEQMDRLGTPRSALSLNALLIACNKCKKFEKVQDLFFDMKDRFKITPNEGSYRALIKSYCSLGELQKAMHTIRELEDRGMEVTNATFSTVLKYLYKEARFEEADQLLTEMVDKGVELDVYTYNVIIMHASDVGDLKRVKDLIKQMEVSRLKPNTITFYYLFNCYFKCGKTEELKRIYEELERSGSSLNAETLRSLVSYFCKKGDFDAGFLVLKTIAEKEIIPAFDTLEHLLRGLVATNRIKEANMMTKIIWKKISPCSLKAWGVLKDLHLPSIYSTVDEMLENSVGKV